MKHNKKRLLGKRTEEQIRRHYEIEKDIATRLKISGKEGRKKIYKTMYEELFRKVPDHPRLMKREDPKAIAANNRSKFALVNKFINKFKVFLEFGSGCCSFATDLCKRVKYVYAVDISDQRLSTISSPRNFRLLIYNGYDLNLPEGSIDIIFSDQLLEHLHPEDVYLHFTLAKKLLKSRGIYIFRTPHRFSGPYDISRYFSNEAEGFHLKEWSYTEIAEILSELCYSGYRGYWYGKRFCIQIPFIIFIIFESIIKVFPRKMMKIVSRILLPYVTITATK